MFAMVISGCVTVKGQDQSVFSHQNILLQNNQTVGQTFVALNDGLDGIEVYLSPGEQSKGEIRLHIRTDPNAESDIVNSIIPLEEVTEPGFYRFSFDPIEKSRQQYYYGFFELEGMGNLWFGHGPGDSYLNGASYQDHEPTNRQMAFHLSYDPLKGTLGFGVELIRWIGILMVGAFLFILPGLGLLSVLLPKSEGLPLLSKIIISGGISLAIYPILFLWTDLVGLHLGPSYALLPPMVGLALLIWTLLKRRETIRLQGLKRHFDTWKRSENLWPDLTMIVMLGTIVLTRMIGVRSLDAPMWGDSYQHTMIAQLLVDNGGLFDSWQPYADLTTFTYHFGFHTYVAAFHWITDLPMYRATLWVGQLINVLAVLAIYPLAVHLGRSRWAGVLAVLIAGVISSMPMVYVNWGRYTQLAGLAILPIMIFFALRVLKQDRDSSGELLIVVILLGGLSLTHYRVLVFAVLFFPVYLIFQIRSGAFKFVMARIALIGLMSAVLFLPWFLQIFEGRILDIFAVQISTPAISISSFTQAYNAIGELSFFLPLYIWGLMLILAAWIIWRRKEESIIIICWWLTILIAANPYWLRLPGTGALSNFAVFISFYIPASLIIGTALDEIIFTRIPKPFQIFILIGLIIMSISQGIKFQEYVDPQEHALVTRPDLRASKWIRDNLESTSRLFTNSFFAFDNNVIVGSDGGWWLPLLANRSINVPPINYGTEYGLTPSYGVDINALTWDFQSKGIDNPDFYANLVNHGYTHIYIGQRMGSVNYPGPHYLNPDELLSSEWYQLIYHEDGVWIFKIVS